MGLLTLRRWMTDGLGVLFWRLCLGLVGCQEVVEHVGEFVPTLIHHFRPSVQHDTEVSPGNGCLLSETETALLATSCVGLGDADWLPDDVGVHLLFLLHPKVVGQGGVVLLAEVGKGGLVVVEPKLECNGSLSYVFFCLISTLSLCFVDKALNLASSLEWAHWLAPSAVASRLSHVHLLLHQLGVVGLDVGLHVWAG